MKKFLLILSALIMVVSVVSCKKDKSVKEKKNPDYTIITMEDLEKINGDNLEIEYKGKRIISINGEFAYFPITDKDKAYEAFMGVAGLLGIEDTRDFVYDENASHENPNGLNAYFFSQYHNDIEVLGATVRITVNPEHTERVDIYSTYEPNLDIDTEPKISREDAVKIASEKYNSDINGSPELVIYKRNLAWDMDLSTSLICRVVMNADNGKILHEEEEFID